MRFISLDRGSLQHPQPKGRVEQEAEGERPKPPRASGVRGRHSHVLFASPRRAAMSGPAGRPCTGRRAGRTRDTAARPSDSGHGRGPPRGCVLQSRGGLVVWWAAFRRGLDNLLETHRHRVHSVASRAGEAHDGTSGPSRDLREREGAFAIARLAIDASLSGEHPLRPRYSAPPASRRARFRRSPARPGRRPPQPDQRPTHPRRRRRDCPACARRRSSRPRRRSARGPPRGASRRRATLPSADRRSPWRLGAEQGDPHIRGDY